MNSKAHMWSEAELMEMFRLRIEGRRSRKSETGSASHGSAPGDRKEAMI